LTWFRDLYQSRELLWVMVYRDLRARTRQSFLGYAWAVLQPLLATGVFTILVQKLLNAKPSGDTPYAVFLFAGMVLWTFFSGALAAATEALVLHGDLLTQVNFSRETLVFYPIVGKFIDFGLGAAVLVVINVLYGIGVPIHLLPALLLVVPTAILAFGLGLLAAPLNVAFRDVGKAMPLLLSFALYLAPILYPIDRVPTAWRGLYVCNPMVGLVDSFRRMAVFGQWPDPRYLAIAVAMSLLAFVVGQVLFNRFEIALADVV
jgi:lipopolysaccharide transport system permease protein